MVKFLLLIASLVLTACQHSAEPSLYQRLGGEQGVENIVDGVLSGIEHDQSIVHHFADTDIPRFRGLLIEQFCQLSGGPCKYTGVSMQESHTGYNITQAHFDALVNHLISAMQQQNVAIEAQNEFLAILAPMYKDVVYR
jgi:hemoglobin